MTHSNISEWKGPHTTTSQSWTMKCRHATSLSWQTVWSKLFSARGMKTWEKRQNSAKSGTSSRRWSSRRSESFWQLHQSRQKLPLKVKQSQTKASKPAQNTLKKMKSWTQAMTTQWANAFTAVQSQQAKIMTSNGRPEHRRRRALRTFKVSQKISQVQKKFRLCLQRWE